MSQGFEVRYTDSAREDLLRLFDFLLDRVKTTQDFDDAQFAIDTIVREVGVHLTHSPFIFRKVGSNPFVRELIVPFRRAGYVVLYEIEGSTHVNILAVRHQREDDYH